ncbi:MAG: hemolysin family protein [Saprospiraceae bacterium]|nr:hemolysin family protein [Saprospiraceae bacterium]
MASLILLIILTILNGFFTMSEIALASSRKVRLETAAKKGSAGAKVALALVNSPNRYFSTVQIGITVITLILGRVGGEAYANDIVPYIEKIPFINQNAHVIAEAVNIIFVAFITIAFGEMIPKRIGMANPETVARFVAIPLDWISTISRPFGWLLSKITELFMRLLNVKMDESKITEEEIKAIIDEGATAGTIEEIEQDIVENVFHLGDKKVGSLMTNRSDIVWLDADESYEENLVTIEKYAHGVYPVCEGELDNVLGVVTVKDLMTALLQKKVLNLRTLVRQVNYFPETMSAYAALNRFKESKIHQALVVDEYGTLVGIVTINDVFDTLVGDISQDDQQNRYEMTERPDGSFLIDGQYPWDDFIKEFELDDNTHNREGFHTLGGFILHILGELPKTGEKIKWNDFDLEVIDMDGMRIDKVLVTRKNN